jgi:hypothetical protein
MYYSQKNSINDELLSTKFLVFLRMAWRSKHVERALPYMLPRDLPLHLLTAIRGKAFSA